MGFFRGLLLVLVSILLLISLLAGNTFLTLTLSLKYDNVKPAIVSAAGTMLGGGIEGLIEEQIGIDTQGYNLTEEVDKVLDEVEEYCMNNTEYVFNEAEYEFVIPCDVVEGGTQAIVEKEVEDFVDDNYYQEYDCDFWDCLEETGSPMFLISQKAHDYWQKYFYYAIIISLILAVLAFLFVGKKKNFPILLGILLVISSLPFMKLKPFFSFLDDTYFQFISIFISRAPTVFWTMLIVGLAIIAFGILIHFVGLGNVIAEKLEKFEKKKSVKKKEKAPKEKESKKEEK